MRLTFELPYVLQEMENINEPQGVTELKPRPKIQEAVDLKKLSKMTQLHHYRSLSDSEIQAVTEAVVQEMKMQLAQGNSVKIDGMGTFTVSLSDEKRKQRRDKEGNTIQKPHGGSISVTGINLKVDKKLIADVNMMARPKRVGIVEHQHSPYELHTRLSILKQYLRQFGFISVAKYADIVQLKKGAATRELNAFCLQPDSGITSQGRWSHKVYVMATSPLTTND